MTAVFTRLLPRNSCLAFQTITDDFHSDLHMHSEFEIVYIKSGSGLFQYGKGIPTEYACGDILVIAPWIPHQFIEHSNNHHSISLLFNQDFILPGLFESDLMQDIKVFLKKLSIGLIFHKNIKNSEGDVNKIVSSDSGWDQAISLIYLLKKLSVENESQHFLGKISGDLLDKNYKKLKKIITYINNNAHRKLLLEEVAKEVYMSKNYFSKFFHQQVNMSFRDYLLFIRIDRACHLLAKSNYSIAFISEEVGFESISSFNRGFAKLKKTSPSSYRQAS